MNKTITTTLLVIASGLSLSTTALAEPFNRGSSYQPPQACGMLPVGRADRSSTNLINRWVRRASPNSKS